MAVRVVNGLTGAMRRARSMIMEIYSCYKGPVSTDRTGSCNALYRQYCVHRCCGRWTVRCIILLSCSSNRVVGVELSRRRSVLTSRTRSCRRFLRALRSGCSFELSGYY